MRAEKPQSTFRKSREFLQSRAEIDRTKLWKYEGTPRDGEGFRIAKRDFVSRYDGGESMLHLAQRIYNLLDDVKASGKVCILVAHNGIARVVNSYFNDMTNEEYADFGVKNCEILRYDF